MKVTRAGHDRWTSRIGSGNHDLATFLASMKVLNAVPDSCGNHHGCYE